MSEQQGNGNKRIRPQERARGQNLKWFIRERDSAQWENIQKENIERLGW